MKISQEANERNLKEIKVMQDKWTKEELFKRLEKTAGSQDKPYVPSNKIIITIHCEADKDFKGGGGVAGKPFTKGWWGTFAYWLGIKLNAVGLMDVRISVTSEEEPKQTVEHPCSESRD